MKSPTRSFARATALGLALGVAATGASAQDPSAAAQAPAAGSASPRRDPRGVKGISPFWEAVKKGDDAFITRDYDGALAAYKEALSSEPQNPLGHYRIGSVYLAKGNLDEAQASWETSRRFAANQPALEAKVLFVLADLGERRRNLDAAVTGWTAYADYAKAKPEAKAYAATPVDRKARIATWQKLVTDYGPVKERIAKREAEADAQNRASAH